MDCHYQRWQKVEDMRLKRLWYRIAASKLLDRIKELQNASIHKDDVMSSRGREVARLQGENKRLSSEVETQKRVITSLNNDAKLAIEIIESRKTPVQEWVEGAQINGMKIRIGELERENAKMGLVRDALRNEVAFARFLEECLFCLNPSDIFNALPLEKRKEYFERTND